MNGKKYLVLCAVTFFASAGDALLKRGMNEFGPIDPRHAWRVVGAVANPWVLAGILCLIGFFASYTTALSWADLTYILPATALGYVALTLFGKYFLHERISPARWLGVILISSGVGWVTRGPALTAPRRRPTEASPKAT